MADTVSEDTMSERAIDVADEDVVTEGGLGMPCSRVTTCNEGHCSNGFCAPEGFVYIAPYTFMMGTVGEDGAREDEVSHQVEITRGFFIQRDETTQEEWSAHFSVNPSGFSCTTCPVETIN